MKRYLYRMVILGIFSMLLWSCKPYDQEPKPAKSVTQFESKLEQMADKYARDSTEDYEAIVAYYDINQEKYASSEAAQQEYTRVQKIYASREAFQKGTTYSAQGDNLAAFDEYLKVEPEDQVNYSEAQKIIGEIKGAVITDIIKEADQLVFGYYYEEALAMLDSIPSPFNTDALVVETRDRYNRIIESLVPYTGEVSHVFFHSLIVDKSKAFDGDSMENGYNYWMTTVPEFKAMMQSMYERGFVLVDIHSFAEKVTDESGQEKYVKKELLLPEGKIPFVLSVDDVNYYEYMKNDGFADRMVLDEDGNVACLLKTADGDVIARDFDVAPLLDVFVEAHPDFSYRGAKGILAVTGYQGILGYRTDLPDSDTYAKDVEDATKVVKRLKETGWLFASHGYGHRHTKQISMALLKDDTEKWEAQVMSLVGPTDIYIYPYGEEVMPGDEKFTYLQDKGFNIFCGVWSKPFLKIYETSIRMTRRNLDGYTLNFNPSALTDLFDPTEVFDQDRPVFR